eukprot:5944619-Heterocapsa_arctica.AAC.1
MGVTREIDDWQSLVYDGVKRARQQAWEKSARNRHNYRGMERGIDEATTRKHYFKFARCRRLLLMESGHHKEHTKDIQKTTKLANVYFVNRKMGGQITSGGTVLLSIGKLSLDFCTSMTEGRKKTISLNVFGMLETSPRIGLLFPSQNICWQKTLVTF